MINHPQSQQTTPHIQHIQHSSIPTPHYLSKQLLLALIIHLLAFTSFYINQIYYLNIPTLILYSLFLFTVLLQSSVIIFDLIRTNSICPDKILLHYCNICNLHVHPTSRHCYICQKCIANFDHHCKWLNTCIAGHNYKLFIILLICQILYITVYLVYCCLLMKYWKTLWSAILGWVMGVVECIVLLLMCVLLLFHMMLWKKGISTYEYLKMSLNEGQQRVTQEQIL